MCGLTQASLYTGEHFQDKQPTFDEEKSNSWTLTGYEDERSCTHAQKNMQTDVTSVKGRGGVGGVYTQTESQTHTNIMKAAPFNDWGPSVWSFKKPESEVIDCN